MRRSILHAMRCEARHAGPVLACTKQTRPASGLFRSCSSPSPSLSRCIFTHTAKKLTPEELAQKASSAPAFDPETGEELEGLDKYNTKIRAFHDKHKNNPIQLKGVRLNGSTKRFYNEVTVEEIEEGKFAIIIQGRKVQTVVTKETVAVPTRALAMAVAFEWDSQLEYVQPHSMPLMHLTTLALDQVAKHRTDMIASMMKYCDFDNACLRDYECNSLVRLQTKHWDPVVEWMKARFGIELVVTQPGGNPIETVKQDAKVRERLQEIFDGMNDWEIAVLDSLSAVSRSLSVSLAVMYGQIDVNRAYECSRLEENYQMRRYGRVDGVFGHGIDIEYTRLKIAAGRSFLNLGGFGSNYAMRPPDDPPPSTEE